MRNLESEILTYRQELTHLRTQEKLEYLSRIDSINQLLSGRQDLFQKLKAIADETGPGDSVESLDSIINAIYFRLGCQASERRKCIEIFGRQMLDFLIPAAYKYILYSSHKGTGIFNHGQYERKHSKMSKYKQFQEKDTKAG